MAIQNFMQEQIDFVFNDCQAIKLYKNGKQILIKKGSKEFDKIMEIWQINIKNGYEMPSLGVALHEETINSLQDGLYIEFLFDKTIYHNEMPFDSLLMQIVENQGGYQLTRHFDNQYQGRCYYINMFEINNDLYDFVNNFPY